MRLIPWAKGLGRAAAGATLLTSLAAAQATSRVSVDSSGVEGTQDSWRPALSTDGMTVAFMSYADNLVAGDSNGASDIFVFDRNTWLTECVSVDSSGVPGDSYSDFPSITADGRFVSFTSKSDNLVVGDQNGFFDIFVYDRKSATTERVSVDSNGNEADLWSYESSISADGQLVAFSSAATNLVANDGNGMSDVFVHDRSTGITECVSVDSAGVPAKGSSYCNIGGISADGRYVAFWSDADNLVARDGNGTADVFVRDRKTGTTTRVSVDSSGAEGNGPSYSPSISGDGRVVAYYSFASNLVVGDKNGMTDVFIYDNIGATTDRVSVDSSGAEGGGNSWSPAVAANGGGVAFFSDASNLVEGDTNARLDAFYHDFATGRTERVSLDSAGVEGNEDSLTPSISADGLAVAFSSSASNLVYADQNGASDIFVCERCDATASWTNYGAGFPGTYGVPTFTSQNDPVLGASLTLDLDNSLDADTIGILFFGFSRVKIHSGAGGDLLVAPFISFVIAVPAKRLQLTVATPYSEMWCGAVIDLQVWEADPGAARGVSFTPGLELVFGH